MFWWEILQLGFTWLFSIALVGINHCRWVRMPGLEVPLLSAGASAAGAGGGGKVPLPDSQSPKIGEVFTILELKNEKKKKKKSLPTYLTYSSFWSPLRKLETFPLTLFSPSCTEHTGSCTPAPWHPATLPRVSRWCLCGVQAVSRGFRGSGPWPTLLLHCPESAGTFKLAAWTQKHGGCKLLTEFPVKKEAFPIVHLSPL